MTNKQGLYIHVPFCKSRCVYCGFFSTTQGSEAQDDFISALDREAAARRQCLGSATMDSIYIGGGTPSALGERNLGRLLGMVRSLFGTSPGAEVTVEVNPNDVTPSLVRTLRENGVNRVSMGIQSFNDSMLRFLHRRHNAQEALSAVDTVISGGIDNISIDLIYGLPSQTMEDWSSDLHRAFSLPVSHLSAYSLMFDEGTPLTQMRDKGLIEEADEELSLQMFKMLMREARESGFLHYEISNFALPGRQARHNTGYWNGMRYLGLGPGAHSYDGDTRWHNIGDLKAYIRAFSGEANDCSGITQTERLTLEQKKEEMLLTALRTARGLRLEDYAQQFGEGSLDGLMQRAAPFLNDGSLILSEKCRESFADNASSADNKNFADNVNFADSASAASHESKVLNGFLSLSTKGVFVSDYIISSLFE